jgi:tetratricopeptide (TPR) repeat protein
MYKEAAQCLEAAYERFATSEIPVMDWGILARLLSATGRWEKGLYILKSTLPPSSNNAQTEWVRASLFLTMGKILDDAGDLDGCLNAYRECIQIGLEKEDEDGDFDWKNVGAALHNMGLACERRGRLDEAINYFEQAYEIAEEPIALERIEKLKARKEQG